MGQRAFYLPCSQGSYCSAICWNQVGNGMVPPQVWIDSRRYHSKLSCKLTVLILGLHTLTTESRRVDSPPEDVGEPCGPSESQQLPRDT